LRTLVLPKAYLGSGEVPLEVGGFRPSFLVIRLSRSLIAAGVPSVIVSLWSVPDSTTTDLITSFYHNLDTNPNKAQALRQAMLTTMKAHPNPIDWAAFTLIGETE
jgi:CHAT domain-containing protein